MRSSIVELRARLAAAAAATGGRLLAAGTHPFAHWSDDGGVTPEPAYLRLQETYGQLTDEQMVCGCHVHVGVRDPELAIAVMNRARPWIPLLVAVERQLPVLDGRRHAVRQLPHRGVPPVADRRAARSTSTDRAELRPRSWPTCRRRG